MAEHAKHDGRFGAQFDDEISGRGVVRTILGVAVLTAVAMIAMLLLWRYQTASRATPSAVATPRLAAQAESLAAPPTPSLQTDPEAELEVLRQEMANRLHGYGWADEAAGVVYMPVEQAMALVLERGLAGGSAEPVAPTVDAANPSSAPEADVATTTPASPASPAPVHEGEGYGS